MMQVYIVGAGKAGRCMGRALRAAGYRVVIRSGRRPLPQRVAGDAVLVAVRDGRIGTVASELRGRVDPGAVVLHLAGAHGPEALGALRGWCAGVGQLHPLVAFASARSCPELRGVFAHVDGDPAARRVGRELAKGMGMRPATIAGIDLQSYHAAAGLVASGAVALVQAGVEILAAQGIASSRAVAMLGPLLASVAHNVKALGLPGALTGVTRRGDAALAQAHLEAIERAAPGRGLLYVQLLAAQLPLARALGEASKAQLECLDRLVLRSAAGRRARRLTAGVERVYNH